jgi:hypothetical protein
MIARIKIEINLKEQEAISFLRKNEVKLKTKSPFGLIEHSATWKNLENPKNFKFEIDTFGPVNPWWGKCSLIENGNKTILSILILPPKFFMVFGGFILSGIIYAIIQFGIHNYGTSGFLPSILIPSFFMCIVFLIWLLMARYNANNIKRDMIASFEEQLKNSVY